MFSNIEEDVLPMISRLRYYRIVLGNIMKFPRG